MLQTQILYYLLLMTRLLDLPLTPTSFQGVPALIQTMVSYPECLPES